LSLKEGEKSKEWSCIKIGHWYFLQVRSHTLHLNIFEQFGLIWWECRIFKRVKAILHVADLKWVLSNLWFFLNFEIPKAKTFGLKNFEIQVQEINRSTIVLRLHGSLWVILLIYLQVQCYILLYCSSRALWWVPQVISYQLFTKTFSFGKFREESLISISLLYVLQFSHFEVILSIDPRFLQLWKVFCLLIKDLSS